MKKYGVWNVILLTASGEVVKQDVTATSGKDARARVEKLYEGCEVFKMARVEWLHGFSYAQLSSALLNVYPNYGLALTQILADNGVFSVNDDAPETVNDDAPETVK
nr:MAG TPA: hypothetical protein [Bacteriophage sp.]